MRKNLEETEKCLPLQPSLGARPSSSAPMAGEDGTSKDLSGVTTLPPWAVGMATQAPFRKILARIFEILARI